MLWVIKGGTGSERRIPRPVEEEQPIGPGSIEQIGLQLVDPSENESSNSKIGAGEP